jgi:hypothetical protein
VSVSHPNPLQIFHSNPKDLLRVYVNPILLLLTAEIHRPRLKMTNETKKSSAPTPTLGDRLQFSATDFSLRYAPSWTPFPAESHARDHYHANLQALAESAEKIVAFSETMKPAENE